LLQCIEYFFAIDEKEQWQYSKLSIDLRHYDCGSNALKDRGWKTHVLLLGDGNEIHETSRVTSSFVCLRSGILDAPTIIENTEMRSIRMHANVSDRQRIEGPISF